MNLMTEKSQKLGCEKWGRKLSFRRLKKYTHSSSRLQNSTENGRPPWPAHGERWVQCTSKKIQNKVPISIRKPSLYNATLWWTSFVGLLWKAQSTFGCSPQHSYWPRDSGGPSSVCNVYKHCRQMRWRTWKNIQIQSNTLGQNLWTWLPPMHRWRTCSGALGPA